MYNTTTRTLTYTVIDIRKTFEGFEADLRMIARKTGKWTTLYVDELIYDIIKFAEAKYLHTLDIVLLDSIGKPVQAAKYTINHDGKSLNGERAGGNDWNDMLNTQLTIILTHNQSWQSLSALEKESFKRTNSLKINWSPSQIDSSFPHLSKASGQLYASNGYELQKLNYK